MSVLLVTANVGSVFEDEELLVSWIQEFSQKVLFSDPIFLALHCQEVGGKHEKRVTNQRFQQALLQCLPQFSSSYSFIDCDIGNKFTALSSFYLWKESKISIRFWNFFSKIFEEKNGNSIHFISSSSLCCFCEKYKFPETVAEEAIKARKGFLRVRLLLKENITSDFVNIHLFHDACNIRASNQFPSQFARIRKSALQWTLSRIEEKDIPLFIFGDFNFRCDTRGLIESLRLCSPKRKEEKLLFYNKSNELLLSIGRKSFELKDKQLFGKQFICLKSLDKELESFSQILSEFQITFPPSYPFGEDIKTGIQYMTTRCPAWCDRILMNSLAKSLAKEANYWLMGSSHPMGDHKPICLTMKLIGNSRFVRTSICGTIFKETDI